jgi:hypothetical protein
LETNPRYVRPREPFSEISFAIISRPFVFTDRRSRRQSSCRFPPERGCRDHVLATRQGVMLKDRLKRAKQRQAEIN